MDNGKCSMKDNPQAVAAGKTKAREFEALQAAHPGREGKANKGKCCTTKERIKKKVKAAVLRAQEEAVAATATAATTTTNTIAPVNNCAPPVQNICVQPPYGPASLFGGATSVVNSTISPPGMQHYGSP